MRSIFHLQLFLCLALSPFVHGANPDLRARIGDTKSPELVLAEVRSQLGSDRPALLSADLRVEHVREGLSATHYTFSQWFDQAQVYGAFLTVSVGADGVAEVHVELSRTRAIARGVSADLLPELRRRHPELEGRPIVSRRAGLRNVDGVARSVERVAVEDAPYRVTLWDVDPVTGVVLAKTPTWTSADGRVFESNPTTALNDPTIRDGGDSSTAVPASAYSIVGLERLPSAGELHGPHVRIVDIDSPFTTRARVEAGLQHERDRDEFEEVNVYHHIDRSQAYLQSLGYSGSRQILPQGVRIDVHANSGADNSYYSSTTAGPTILFGDGGVDDAEDPDIVLHEYAHAIHDALSPTVLFGGADSEARAMSEGFGDYWAFSSGFPSSAGSGRDPFCIGDWDARCDGPDCGYSPSADCLRRVDLELDMSHFSKSKVAGTEHQNGRIWSRFLRDAFLANVSRFGIEEGRRRTDTLVLEGLQGLPPNPGFAFVVDRMIRADELLFGAATSETLCTAARGRAFAVPLSCSPPMRGDVLILQGSGSVQPAPGTTVTARRTLLSDAVITDIDVHLDLAETPPDGLEIALTAPDGTRAILKQAGTPAPAVATYGRDRLPDEPLEPLEGRPNPGEWTLTMSAPPGSAVVRLRSWTLLLRMAATGEDARPRSPDSRRIPAAGHTPGAAGTFFVTDLMLANPGAARELTLVYTPSGTDGTASFQSVRVPIGAHSNVVLRDVVRSVFDASGIGSLEILGASDAVRISSRTYNRSTTGTFGQTVPRVRDTADAGAILIIPQIRETSEYRTNIGFVETNGKAAEIDLMLLGPAGETLGTSTVALAPWEHRQFPLSFVAQVQGLASGWAEIRVRGDGTIAGYASVVDNRTGDSVYVPAMRPLPSPEQRVIPAVANTSGAKGTRWRSDLWLVNPTAQAETVALSYHGADGTTETATLSLEPRSSLFIPDVVGSLIGAGGVGSLVLSPSSLMITSRTWNEGTGGSYGQFIPSFRTGASLRTGQSAVIPSAVMNAEFRTNVGLTEVAGQQAAVRVTVTDAEGEIRCSRSFELLPFQQQQLSVLDIGCSALDGGMVTIEHDEGAGGVVAYGSVVDQRTGDPSFLPAE